MFLLSCLQKKKKKTSCHNHINDPKTRSFFCQGLLHSLFLCCVFLSPDSLLRGSIWKLWCPFFIFYFFYKHNNLLTRCAKARTTEQKIRHMQIAHPHTKPSSNKAQVKFWSIMFFLLQLISYMSLQPMRLVV